jgi:ankyrin repeat protein
MPTLPERASLDWLKKTAKQNLQALRAADPQARLADAQLALARSYGFPSWRALKAHVEAPAAPLPEPVVAAFLRAVGDGETEKVRAALAAEPRLANAVGPHPYWGGRPQPLHVAIETKRRDMFDLLLAAGADVDGCNEDYDRWSPLMLTFSREREDMRTELLRRGARIGLIDALLMKDDRLVDALLEDGLPEIGPNEGSILAFARTTHAIDRLLALGASADAADRWGVTPIVAMSRAGPEGRELVRHMMLRGVVPRPREFARLGDQGTLAILVDANPEIVLQEAVMIAAVDSGNHALVRWLLSQGGNPNARDLDADTRHGALHSAAWNGDLEMVELLAEAGADLQLRDAKHDAPPWGWATTAITVTNNAACRKVADWLAQRAPPR